MKSNTSLLVRVAAALFILLSLVTIINLQVRMNDLDRERAELEKQVYNLREDIAELEYQINLPYDDNYAAKVARDILGYHFPDELLFINDLYDD